MAKGFSGSHGKSGGNTSGALIHIAFDTTELQNLQATFPAIGKAVRLAYLASLRRAVQKGVSSTAKRFQSIFPGVSQREFKEVFLRSVVIPDKDISKISGMIRVKGRHLFLERVKPKRTKTGVSYVSGGKTVEIKGAFFAKVFRNNKEPHWWRRDADRPVKDKSGRVGRFKVKVLWGPSPYNVFANEANSGPVRDDMAATLERELDRQLGFYLNRAVAREAFAITNE